MLHREAVLGWSSVEHVLYEENGHQFIIELDLFNNHKYFWWQKDNTCIPLAEARDEDIYDAIEQFNKIVVGEPPYEQSRDSS